MRLSVLNCAAERHATYQSLLQKMLTLSVDT